MKNTIRGSRQQPQTGGGHAIRGQKADKTNRIINICTYNTRTINDLNTDARDAMLQELENVNWDVIGFSEMKEKDNKIELLDVGHKIFFSSNGTTRSNGGGFLVNKRFASLIEDYRPLSEIEKQAQKHQLGYPGQKWRSPNRQAENPRKMG